MEKKIKTLEALSKPLETAGEERKHLFHSAGAYAERFLGRLDEAPGYETTQDRGAGLAHWPIGEEPRSMETCLDLLSRFVDRPGVNGASGRHLAYIPGSSLYESALGQFLAAVTNRYSGLALASPGAVRMENQVLRFLADMLGMPTTAAGNLTSGGSLASLIGTVVAREACQIKTAQIPKTVTYLTRETHHAVTKGLRVAGMEEAILRIIPMDECFRMRIDLLEKTIQADRKLGLSPWMVVASAGTTNTGSVDPLDGIADFARQNNLWFHVDGAYGAPFNLCDTGKAKLKGIHRADSVVLDPHKGLFIPFGLGAVLVKNGDQLRKAFSYQADYLRDNPGDAGMDSPADLSPEFTRPFRALGLWLPLQLHGVAPFRAALEEKLLLAQYAYDQISGWPRFELGPAPELTVVTFRYRPEKGDANQFNRLLAKKIWDDGRVFMSSTILDGKVTLRLTILSFRTHLETVDFALNIVSALTRELVDQT